MSISQIESKIKSLQAEIARLNKQNTTEAGKEAKAQEAIRRTQKSIHFLVCPQDKAAHNSF